MGGERGEESARRKWRWKSAEVEARDYRESAERAHEKFMQVVTGDVFYDAAAAFHAGTSAVDEFGAEKEIASGTKGVAERGVDAGSDRATESRSQVVRDQEREKLVALKKGGIQFCYGHTGVRGDGEVGWVVVCDLVQAGHVQCDVVPGGGRADGKLGARASGDHCEAFFCGETDDFGGFFGGGGPSDGRGRDTVNRVGRNVSSGDIVWRVRDRLQSGGDIVGHGTHPRVTGCGGRGPSRVSPQPLLRGKILPGFSRQSGLVASWTRRIRAKSASENSSGMSSLFSIPIPCSPDRLPPTSTQ